MDEPKGNVTIAHWDLNGWRAVPAEVLQGHGTSGKLQKPLFFSYPLGVSASSEAVFSDASYDGGSYSVATGDSHRNSPIVNSPIAQKDITSTDYTTQATEEIGKELTDFSKDYENYLTDLKAVTQIWFSNTGFEKVSVEAEKLQQLQKFAANLKQHPARLYTVPLYSTKQENFLEDWMCTLITSIVPGVENAQHIAYALNDIELALNALARNQLAQQYTDLQSLMQEMNAKKNDAAAINQIMLAIIRTQKGFDCAQDFVEGLRGTYLLLDARLYTDITWREVRMKVLLHWYADAEHRYVEPFYRLYVKATKQYVDRFLVFSNGLNHGNSNADPSQIKQGIQYNKTASQMVSCLNDKIGNTNILNPTNDVYKMAYDELKVFGLQYFPRGFNDFYNRYQLLKALPVPDLNGVHALHRMGIFVEDVMSTWSDFLDSLKVKNIGEKNCYEKCRKDYKEISLYIDKVRTSEMTSFLGARKPF